MHHHSRHSTAVGSPRHGFTLLELLVVVSIIGIVASLVLSVSRAMRKNADRNTGLSHMRQLATAFVQYAGDHDLKLPSPAERKFDRWPKLLAPYVKDVTVYGAPGTQGNFVTRNADPISNSSNNTSFLMNGFNDLGGFDKKGGEIPLVRIDDPVNTLLLGMQKPGSRHFYMDFLEPPHGNQKDLLDTKAYGDGSNYAFVDGSVRFITEKDYRDELWLADKKYEIPSM